MKPGAGGLECDIGGVGDVIAQKRGSLGPEMVEVAMFLKLNRHMLIRDTTKVKEMGSNWKEYIPSRPEFPIDYDGYSEDEMGLQNSNAGLEVQSYRSLIDVTDCDSH